MILIIDNFDSFIHILARYVRELGYETNIIRNDCDAEFIAALPKARGLIVSPGPNAPAQAGISMEAIQQARSSLPIWGICLGHQCLVETYGGVTVRAYQPMHGRSSLIDHDGKALFANIPNPMEVGRYHSLVSEIGANNSLTVCAKSGVSEIMAVRHKTLPRFGVQFHPESILTPDGMKMTENFLSYCR